MPWLYVLHFCLLILTFYTKPLYIMASQEKWFSCTMCSFSFSSHVALMSHVVQKHKSDKGFIVYCSVKNCMYSTSNWNNFRKHHVRKHKEIPLLPDDSTLFQNQVDHDTEMEVGFEESSVGDIDLQVSNLFSDKMFTAKYLIKLETEHKLSQVGLTDVVDGTQLHVTRALNNYKTDLKVSLQQQGYPTSILDASLPVKDPALSDFETAYKRKQFYLSTGFYVEPKQVLLGRSFNPRKECYEEVYGQYVPILSSLKVLLQLPEVQYFLKYPHNSRSEMLKDICDGGYVANDDILKDPRSLQIIVNHDDLEMANPLGVHTKKNKMSMFYYSIANLPPQFRSKLRAVQLIAIAKSQKVRAFGVNHLLQDFISGVSALQKGIEIEVNGKKQHLRGSIVLIPCDTPAAQWLGGFKEGVSFANKPCRTCPVSSKELSSSFLGSSFPVRDKEQHRARVMQLAGMDKKEMQYWSKFWGINGESPFLELNISLSDVMAHDPMHVLLEGIVPVEMALFLFHAIFIKKYFTLTWLNKRVYSYSYLGGETRPERIEKNQLTTSTKVKQKSAGILMLCYILPHIVGPKVADDDKKYINLLRLIQIVLLSTSPYVTENTAGELEVLIAEHHHTYEKIYPNEKITPKFHYLIHFPRQILLFGPLRHQWVMRFEGKNCFFSRFPWNNFINLEKSMAQKHQLYMCGQMMSGMGEASRNFLYSGDIIGEGRVCDFSDLAGQYMQQEFEDLCVKNDISLPFPLQVYTCKQIEVHGLTYRPGMALLIDWDEDDTPHFACISELVVLEDIKFFLLQDLTIVHYELKMNAYEVMFNNMSKVIRQTDLKNTWPLPIHSYKTDEKKFLFKVRIHQSEVKSMVLASSIKEIKEAARSKLSLTSDLLLIKLEDDTEVDDDLFLPHLVGQTLVIHTRQIPSEPVLEGPPLPSLATKTAPAAVTPRTPSRSDAPSATPLEDAVTPKTQSGPSCSPSIIMRTPVVPSHRFSPYVSTPPGRKSSLQVASSPSSPSSPMDITIAERSSPQQFAHLPEFDTNTKALLSKGDSRAWKDVINILSNYHVNMRKKEDYKVMGEMVVGKYPCLARSGFRPWSMLNKCLSKKIRSLRELEKKRSSSPKTPPASAAVSRASLLPAAAPETSTHLNEAEFQTHLATLRTESLKPAASRNQSKITLLLQETYGNRKAWVSEKFGEEACLMAPVLQEYSCMREDFALLEEFRLRLEKSHDEMKEMKKRLEAIIEKGVEDLPLKAHKQPDDIQSLTALQDIEKKVAIKHGKGTKSTSVFITLEEEEDFEDVLSSSGSSPYLVISCNGDGIANIMVCGDGEQVHCKHDVASAVLTLLGCYYVFDIVYPRCYSQMLGLLQQLVVGEVFTGSKTKTKGFVDMLQKLC